MIENSNAETRESSWAPYIKRFNELTTAYQSLGGQAILGAFSRAMANMPSVQNARVKSISTLPGDVSKETLGALLQNPAGSELPLRAVSEILNYTNYSTYKMKKSYADMLTYRHYCAPLYISQEMAEDEKLWREMELVDKINKAVRPEETAHKIALQALNQEKVYYILRHKVDKVHNSVDYVFAQQLPTDWCKIIGFNNISKYTISFNMMYFMQLGTDWTQFGDLFAPYIDDFLRVIEYGEDKPRNPRFVYAESGKYGVCPDRLNKNAEGSPKMFMQNGRWFYYVSLPIDRVWTFEINDASPIAVPFNSGLMQTFSQQADFEAVQYALCTLPLIKIFTGEIPFYDKNGGASSEDRLLLSGPMRDMFVTMFDILMSEHNTGGTAFYGAPFQNIKSHSYSESANANQTSSEFLKYGFAKTGLSSLIPVTDTPHAGLEKYSAYLESRFADRIYGTFGRMMENLYKRIGLKYSYSFTMFGSVYTDAETRNELQKSLDKGDISAYLKLAALDGMSLLDKLSFGRLVKASGWLDMLTPPQTSYTQTTTKSSAQGGAPEKSEAEVQATVVEKQVEGQITSKN